VIIAHLSVLAAVIEVALRRWDSRVLTAGLEYPLAAWFTLAAAGSLLAAVSLIFAILTRRGSREANRRGALDGWRHLLPPLAVAGLLVAALWHLETYPLPNLTTTNQPSNARE
jgi:hypothetical protein